MTDSPASITSKPIRWSLAGALGAGILASACCTVPLLLVMLGVGGAWLGTLRALEPLRPVFVVLAAGFLFFAFRRARATGPEVCEPGTACAEPQTHRRTQLVLWIAAVATALLLVSPALIGWLAR